MGIIGYLQMLNGYHITTRVKVLVQNTPGPLQDIIESFRTDLMY